MARDIGGAGDLDLHDTGVCSGRVRLLWSLRFESGKLLLGILNGLLPLGWLEFRVC